uniref:Si:ch211-188p14.5 n=1 Tax=Amphiprion percula TaxID=161767 RepID=A0A3P8TLE2_AMPPE
LTEASLKNKQIYNCFLNIPISVLGNKVIPICVECENNRRCNTDVKKENCRSYFSAVGAADFSVASEMLNKGPLLLSEARTCLGINGTSLSRDDVVVLGNMVAAMVTVLLSGKTQYGYNDGVKLKSKIIISNPGFLKSFMPKLRKTKTEKRRLKKLFKQISNHVKNPRSGICCTVGNITQVTASDTSFPFRYDQTLFDLCLGIPVLKDNLNSICEKVENDDFQKIILQKLNQAFPAGVSDQEVQVLGSVSRMASLHDISKWSITTTDTLAALMKAEDGSWKAAKSKEIITKYLSTSGKSLDSIELNMIDSNLCSLNTSTLKTISPDSIRNAKPLNVASCSAEQRRVLYEISNAAFRSQTGNPSIFYGLIKSCLVKNACYQHCAADLSKKCIIPPNSEN